MGRLKLYSYFRSSASYRVRIALGLKGLDYELLPVNLLAGAQRTADFLDVNPQGLLPTLVDGDATISQSLAIIEYLEETHRRPRLLPEAPAERARVRQLALLVACEIHPLQNLDVRRRLAERFGADEPAQHAWSRDVIERGLVALERLLARDPRTGTFCHGERPTVADLFLVPQIYNAERYRCELSGLPTVRRIYDACMREPAFAEAAPERQPDRA